VTDSAVLAKRKVARGERRRLAILKAATEVFLERGYEGTTLDEVIRRSGGSRATLYELFGNKEGLFAAIIAESCDEIVAPLPEPDALTAIDPREALEALASTFLGVMLTPTNLALYRAVIAEGVRFPELGALVFRSGPLIAAERLSVYLRHQTEAGVLSVPDADLAARQFLEMIKGDLHFRALLNPSDLPSADEVDDCVGSAVTLFLEGVRRRDRSPS
jgi:AcrR family transcriptional regulator